MQQSGACHPQHESANATALTGFGREAGVPADLAALPLPVDFGAGAGAGEAQSPSLVSLPKNLTLCALTEVALRVPTCSQLKRREGGGCELEPRAAAALKRQAARRGNRLRMRTPPSRQSRSMLCDRTARCHQGTSHALRPSTARTAKNRRPSATPLRPSPPCGPSSRALPRGSRCRQLAFWTRAWFELPL